MVLYNNQSVGVSWLVKELLKYPNQWATVDVGSIEGRRLNEHKIRVCTESYKLEYVYYFDDGTENRQTWYISQGYSNLPNRKEAIRYYLISKNKRISKLHFFLFIQGLFLISRHDYKHHYRSQIYSVESVGLKHHDYDRRIERLLKEKKRLVLYYNGKRTRTAKRLDYYERMSDYYNELADAKTARWLSRFYD